VLPRRGLVDRLLRVPPRGLGLIVAPVGHGGSTLLDLLAESAPEIVVRVGLGHPGAELVGGLAARLSSVGIPVDDDPGADRAARLAAVVAALRTAPEVLVLIDDLATGPDDPNERALGELLAVLPDTTRVVARARRAPSIDVSRLLTGGRLVLLDRGDLLLSADEADALLATTVPWLAPGRRAVLRGLAEGWVGAISAGTLGPGGSAEHDPAVWLLGSGLDLLVGPSVAALHPVDRELLVRASVLQRLTADACDALTGRTDSGERLARLAADQLVHPLPPGRGSGYGMHGLLREHLRRLLDTQPGAEQAAHASAARWYEQRGLADEAITHCLAAGDVAGAARVLDGHVESLLDAGAAPQVSGWFRTAPQLALATSDLHVLAAGWAEVLSGRPANAVPHHLALQRRASEVVADGREPGATSRGGGLWLQTETQFLGALIDAMAGRTRTALQGLQATRAAYGDAWSRAAHQSAPMMEARLHLWLGRTAEAEQILTAMSSRPGTLAYYRRVQIPAAWAQIAVLDGRVHRGRQLAREAQESLAELGAIAAFDTCGSLVALAGALHDLDRLAEAQAQAEQAVAVAAAAGHLPLEVVARCAEATIRASRADRVGALGALELARTRVREHDASRELARQVDRAAVAVAVASGDRRAAAVALERLGTEQRGQPGARSRTDRSLLMAVAAMSANRPETDVLRLIRAQRPVTPREVVAARLLMATALATTRRAEAAMHLRTAADLAVEQGMLRALVATSEELLVLAAAIGAEPGGAAVRTLLDRATTSPEPLPALPALSAGERELLRLLADAPANRELAAQLGISVNTLKTRLRRLYAKLGVHDRAGALAAVGHEA
jgi:LuxR family maltose regulon positive regulatory protein